MSLALDPTGTYWVTQLQLQLQLHPNTILNNPQVKSAKLPQLPQNASPRSRSHGHLSPSMRDARHTPQADAATGQPGPGPHRTVLAKREKVAPPPRPSHKHSDTHTENNSQHTAFALDPKILDMIGGARWLRLRGREETSSCRRRRK